LSVNESLKLSMSIMANCCQIVLLREMTMSPRFLLPSMKDSFGN